MNRKTSYKGGKQQIKMVVVQLSLTLLPCIWKNMLTIMTLSMTLIFSILYQNTILYTYSNYLESIPHHL